MREARKSQETLRETRLDLDHAKELQAMSRVLNDHPTIAELVWQDLRAASSSKLTTRGAGGLSAEQVLRILVVKQMNGFSYRELAFHLADSRSYRTFCLLASPIRRRRDRRLTPISRHCGPPPWRRSIG